MNKEEILNEIKKTKEHLANMKKMLAECEYMRWKPKDFSPYFYVDSCMKIEQSDFYSDTYIHSERYNTYSTFKTREEAKQEAEKILVRRMLEDIAIRLNKGQKIDWNNFNQNKYFISFNCATQLIERDVYNVKNKVQGVVYCLSDDFVSVAIQEIGVERLLTYLKGE